MTEPTTASWPEKWPTTVVACAEDALRRGMKLSEYLEELEKRLGPVPMPPAGFQMDPHSDVRWLGPEVYHERWIITPVWNSTTGAHSLDVWLADHQPPNYADLSPEDALELAAALAAASRA